MAIVNIHDAKTNLSHLIERAEQGEDIIIGRAGKPVARLMAYRSEQSPRIPGMLKGKVTIAPDFDELPADVLAAFNGERD